MSENERANLSRRSFVRGAGVAALGATMGVVPPAEAAEKAGGELPQSVLGKTGLRVTRMTLGTAPAGIAKTISPQGVAEIVNEALDLGVTCVDTSPKYGNAEEGVGLALGRRRKEIVLATKIWADDVPDAEQKLAESLATLKTDYVDLLYFHHLGDRDVEKARRADGVFTWLLKQKQAGKCRFVGLSGHNLPGRFAPFLETGEVDVILVCLNFVDRHTYDFEEQVLPLARKHNVGVVAMKVFGGPDPKTGSWGSPEAKPNVGTDHVEQAIRYALSLPGVATANLGVHTSKQLRENVEIVKRFQPLSEEEGATLTRLGSEMAPQWGEHFGPVEEAPPEADAPTA
ncbi:MAG: aldo/keto reductase [Pirellulales bacterium]|nr:aldo/keto reductase [Pirellulales bacterium]